jgi:two-component system, cell cycle sensor histidine kinase and response regulator CckA
MLSLYAARPPPGGGRPPHRAPSIVRTFAVIPMLRDVMDYLPMKHRRAMLALGSSIVYCAWYLALFGVVGRGVSAFIVLPVMVVAWAYGMVGAMVASLLGLYVLNPALRVATGEPAVFASWMMLLLLLAIAVAVGRIGELQRRLVRLLAEREAKDQAQLQLAREQAAREEADRARAQVEHVLESITDGFFALDRDSRFTYVNRRAERAFDRSRRALLGRNVWEELGAVLGAEFCRRLEGATARRQTSRFEYRHEATGAVFLVSVFPGEDGVSIYFNNVTARKRAEESMRRSEEHFRALIETNLDGILLLDAGGRIRYESPSARPVLGYAPDEKLGRSFLDYVHPDDRARTAALFADLLAGEDLEPLELRAQRADGSWCVVEARGRNLLSLPAVNGVVVNVRDMTERKAAEAAAHESEASFSALFESISEAVSIHDSNGQILSVNRAVEQMYGLSREALIGLSPELLCDGDRVEPAELLDRMGRALEGEPQRLEWWGRRGNGNGFPVELTITRGRHSGRDAVIVVARDLTERRQLEEQLRQSQKMEAIGRLAGGVAHDFNNLLTAIKGNAEMLLLDEVDAEVESGLDEIVRAADRAGTLTKQLLTFSRKQVIQPRELSLNTTVEGVTPMLRRLIGANIHLRSQLSPGIDAVRADPGQIEQVIVNLVVNARDAMPDGGKLTIETTSVALDDSYARTHVDVAPGRYVMLAVSDTGHGMDASILSQIFEPFFTTKPPGKGTGLGLSTVYGIVKQSGGHIWVYSEMGQGTTFKIYLPCAGRAACGVEVGSCAESPVTGHETVLVVEDEPAVREFIQRALERSGFRVLIAASGEDAMQWIDELPQPPDLLITDLVMPGMGGVRLATLLRERYTDLQVLYTSGYADEAVVHNGVLSAGAEFLQKPFRPDALARRVRELLDQPRAA